ncbi:MAG: hypothetical protein HYX64_11345 [Gammaproteobacteria bacterium]|nr:hypothetical protein [Gammaproteobacteria bacterium]
MFDMAASYCVASIREIAGAHEVQYKTPFGVSNYRLGAQNSMTDTKSSWEKFLHPETLRGNLIAIALFISAFEMFKDRVIEKPETFFSNGFDQNGLIVDEKYKTEVLSKSKSRLYASLLWFKEMEAIDDKDIESFDIIRKYRNEVTHELTDFLSNANRNLDPTAFQRLIALLSKIEKWWLINFEMAINPEMLPDSVNVDDVIPGPIWSLQLMLDIALGNEP